VCEESVKTLKNENYVQKRNKIDENIDKISIMAHKNSKKMSHRLI